MTGRARGETTQMAKTCKILKNTKNASKLSKFLGFAARRMLMSIMVSERVLSQDTEWVGLLLPLAGLGQLPLEYLHLCFANMHSRPIMILHVP